MVAYTAVFRAVADFSSPVRESGRMANAFDRARAAAERIGPSGAKSAKEAADAYEKMQQRAKTAVAGATRAITTARSNEADASRKLAIAETRLNELRKSGKVRASALLEAEDRLVRSKKAYTAAQQRTSAATNEFNNVQTASTLGLARAKLNADKAAKSMDSFGTKMAKAGAATSTVAGELGRSMTLGISVPLAVIGYQAVKTFATFERAIASAGSKSLATTEQLERMQKIALQVGQDTKFSATEAAEAMDQLAAAGFNAEQAMQTLRPVTLAAQAANEDLGLTARVVATSMNAFNLPTERAAHVADLLSNALNTTALDMQGLQDALGQAGEIGPRFGQSMEDVVAVIGRLVDMGVPAASAGTAIRQAISSLGSPTMQANNLINDLGLSLRNTNGEMKPIPDLVRELQTKLQTSNPAIENYAKTIGMSNEELREWAKQNNITLRQATQIQTAIRKGGAAFNDYATKTLFGVEGAKAFSLSMADGKPLIIDTSKELDKMRRLTQGLTAKMGGPAAEAFIKAHTQMGVFTAKSADAIESISALGLASEGLSEQIGKAFQATTAQKIDNLKGSVSSLAITLVKILKPGLDKGIDGLREFFTAAQKFAEANPEITKFALGLAGLLASIGPGLLLFAGLVKAVLAIRGAFISVQAGAALATAAVAKWGDSSAIAGSKVAGAAKGAGKFISFLGGPWGIAIGLAVAGLGYYVAKQREADKATSDFTKTLTFQNGALEESSRQQLAKQLADDGSLAAAVKAGFAEKDYTAALIEGGDARARMIDQLRAQVEAGRQVVTSGYNTTVTYTDQALAADKAARALIAMGAGLDRSKDSAEAQARALGVSAGETQKINDYMRTHKVTADEATVAMEDLGRAETELTTAQSTYNKELKKTIDNFSILKNGALTVAQANDTWQASLDNVKEAVKGNNKALKSGTAEGRENRGAVIGMISALNDKITADVKAKGSTKGVEKAVESGKEAIIRAAHAAGLNKDEVKKMIAQMVKTPKELDTDIHTDGMKEARAQIKKLKEDIQRIKDRFPQIDFRTNAQKIAASVGFDISHRDRDKADGGPITLPKRAAGGPIKGHGHGRQDNIAGIDRKTRIQTSWVSNREFVTNEESYKASKDAVETINANPGKPFAAVPLARGGALTNHGPGNNRSTVTNTGKGVRRQIRTKTAPTPKSLFSVAPSMDQFSSRAAQSFAERFSKFVQKRLNDAMDSGGGPIGGKGYANALKFAKAQVGKPYIYASAGPRGYDCSGFMAAIQNVIEGKAPYRRRYSTPAFHGNKAQGFTRNKRSPFMVGVNPSPGKSGHMAGTLQGQNVESAGGVGVRVGRSARGYNAGMFSWRGGLAAGGPVPGRGGDLPYDIVNPRGQRYDPRVSAFARDLYGSSAYAGGTRSTARGTHLVGERGAELLRTGSGADIMNSKQTLEYLSKIEALAVRAPKNLAATAASRLRAPEQTNSGQQVGDVHVPITVMYAKDNEISTMAAQRALVRGGRKIAAVAGGH